ncbi:MULTISPECIES: hypothetical protein [unclassified Paenibacillus]|uniref:hypothetical protein n=1 Tax=unclassified Paenibacillus TaxID=185978 RepID=UPI001AE4709B|nr:MULTISPECIES: hypothetical protein [unclassified Paenibacillus]MBP1156065.1 putative membrane protein [Paenibacillus sp. PvP091]MBP1168549.1 putative membrane protein [Paenibacillus sp. PvR098]MBP2439577.1 putative membrane protein [Paenibacillus sp. PvP052]
MLTKLKQPGLILGVLGAVKLALDSMGMNIPDETINEIANGISAVLVVISIFMDHGKEK